MIVLEFLGSGSAAITPVLVELANERLPPQTGDKLQPIAQFLQALGPPVLFLLRRLLHDSFPPD